MPPDGTIISAWTNGRKARVYLVKTTECNYVIFKCYRLRFIVTYLRELFATRYLSRRLPTIPHVVQSRIWKAELSLQFIPGERLLEWVLSRYAPAGTDIRAFQSISGLETNSVIFDAFMKFRECRSEPAQAVKKAIHDSYCGIHALGWIHGSADPRNMILQDGRVFIIDFDHARPCSNPAGKEFPVLIKWFGVQN